MDTVHSYKLFPLHSLNIIHIGKWLKPKLQTLVQSTLYIIWTCFFTATRLGEFSKQISVFI
jgi:hypothetical protein